MLPSYSGTDSAQYGTARKCPERSIPEQPVDIIRTGSRILPPGNMKHCNPTPVYSAQSSGLEYCGDIN